MEPAIFNYRICQMFFRVAPLDILIPLTKRYFILSVLFLKILPLLPTAPTPLLGQNFGLFSYYH